ncbi:MAG: threonine synthase [Tatlockia sp.]|nr:threonine synthase [Tatlockia sp.]
MYSSTRDPLSSKTLSAAIKAGLVSDGGLFVPKQIPVIDYQLFADSPFAEFAYEVLKPFFSADILSQSLLSFCKNAFDFPVLLKPLDSNTFVLELFHGPSSSFKDFGARFLALCLNASSDSQKTILVATSGDTGSAVAAAFHRKSNCRVIILYPEGQISARQEQQITCWDENIFALAVDGSFDQCQQLVKSALIDPLWQDRDLSSANSINIGRLLPQLSYYAYAAMVFFRKHRIKPGFIIPSGNFGNATAAYWARAMGFPIREIVMATNANRVLVDYLQNGIYHPRPSIATLANAMDVGDPSNVERLLHLFGTLANFKKNVRAFSVNDEKIVNTIREIYEKYSYISCPHTATAFCTRQQLSRDKPWIVVATADPCKFDEVIEPIINTKVPIAKQLQKLLARPNRIRKVKASLKDISEMVPDSWPLS